MVSARASSGTLLSGRAGSGTAGSGAAGGGVAEVGQPFLADPVGQECPTYYGDMLHDL